MATIQTLVTAPPYVDFLDAVVAHPSVIGLRLNTVMPTGGGPGEALDRLSGLGAPLWVDLKGRQLRVAEAAVPPFTAVRLSQRISVDLPADAFFEDGREHARVVAVDGDRLILASGPRRVIGPGESVNIPHPSLKIEGTLTETDRAYLSAMRERGMRKVMLSFVESPDDLEEIHALLPDAEIISKIAGRKGVSFAQDHGGSGRRLRAARGDLYVEMPRPHQIIGALKRIIEADPTAIVASRLFDSLAWDSVPDSADISDAALLMSLGYQTFMLGDRVCLERDSVMAALRLLDAIAGEM